MLLATLALLIGTPAQGAPAPVLAPARLVELDEVEAARFLARATFGPQAESIATLRRLGAEAWIADQLARPTSTIAPALRFGCVSEDPDQDVLCGEPYPLPHVHLRRALWWEHALSAEDQLRQRVAFALSQIFVISDRNEFLLVSPVLTADFYDTLVEHAFSDYRTLLEELVLHPAMGVYLSHARSRSSDPETGARPDQNCARELLQLFSIGLIELGSDGRARLDAEGRTVPTYGQAEVEGVARVLTGWNHPTRTPKTDDLEAFLGTRARLGRLEPWPAFHDRGAKRLPGGGWAPAGLTPEDDLALLLDTLAEHPNVGPFLSRRLIQRLVTSNPSPDYVERVAAVWGDDGRGRRGRLDAVVRAILLDPEAGWRSDLDPPQGPAKLREPVLRVTALWRALDAVPPAIDPLAPPTQYELLGLGQVPLRAPTVFNFFTPDDTTPALIALGRVAPEARLATHTGLTAVANTLAGLVREGSLASAPRGWDLPRVDLAPLRALAEEPLALVDRVALLLTGGALSDRRRAALVEWIEAIPIAADGAPEPRGHRRAVEAVSLIALVPEAATQW